MEGTPLIDDILQNEAMPAMRASSEINSSLPSRVKAVITYIVIDRSGTLRTCIFESADEVDLMALMEEVDGGDSLSALVRIMRYWFHDTPWSVCQGASVLKEAAASTPARLTRMPIRERAQQEKSGNNGLLDCVAIATLAAARSIV